MKYYLYLLKTPKLAKYSRRIPKRPNARRKSPMSLHFSLCQTRTSRTSAHTSTTASVRSKGAFYVCTFPTNTSAAAARPLSRGMCAMGDKITANGLCLCHKACSLCLMSCGSSARIPRLGASNAVRISGKGSFVCADLGKVIIRPGRAKRGVVSMILPTPFGHLKTRVGIDITTGDKARPIAPADLIIGSFGVKKLQTSLPCALNDAT